MVELESLAGVFARPKLPLKMVAGYTADFIVSISDEGDLTLALGPDGTGQVVVTKGNWLPLYKPEALSFLKSVPVYPQNGQLSVKSVRRGYRVPSFFCDRVFANSVLRWYAKVGDFVAPPGLVMLPSEDTPTVNRLEFQAMSVLPAMVFAGEGDAILWSLTAFEHGGDLFAEAKNEREKQIIAQVNDILLHPGNYFN